MAQVRRYDRGTLRPPRQTAQGFLRADGYAARVGVQKYRNHDGTTRNELRLPEEVFAKTYLDSFDGAPITLGHPDEWVTPSNAKDLGVGTSTEAGKRDGDFVAISSVIDVKRAMDEIKAGVQELSVGYTVDLDMTPGNHPVYGQYDALQRNMVVNHVAIVPSGRAGKEARLRVDEAQVLDEPLSAEALDALLASPAGQQVLRVAVDAALNAAGRHALAPDDFAVAGTEDMPINDAAHVRAAMSRFGEYHFKDASQKRGAYNRIVARAEKLGVDPAGFKEAWSGRLDTDDPTHRRSSPMTPDEIKALQTAHQNEKIRADQLATALDAEKLRASKAEGVVAGQAEELTKLRAGRVDEAKIVGLEAAVADLQKQLEAEKKARRDATAPDVIHGLAEARRKIIEEARAVDPNLRVDDMSNREIMVKTISLINGKTLGREHDDGYVIGQFESLVEGRKSWAGKLPRAHVDTAVTPAAAAAEKKDEKPSFSAMGTAPLPNAVRYGRAG